MLIVRRKQKAPLGHFKNKSADKEVIKKQLLY